MGLSVAEFLKIILLWVDALVLMVGIVLLTLSAEAYAKLENHLKSNVESFNKWMLTKKNLVAAIFIVYAILSFLILFKFQ
ncbi:MAG: hypothetical protein PHE58_03640 [Candidatus Omnitrophica bacterium]|nr:hypothetical protein [Candidatus Omnitrophota bacterium]